MQNEKYINYYIETLSSTLQDILLRNVSLQVTSKIAEESVGELLSSIETYKNELLVKDEQIQRLNEELLNVQNMKSEYENTKHQVNHVDTFRNELQKEREEHKKTREQFEQKIDDDLKNGKNIIRYNV